MTAKFGVILTATTAITLNRINNYFENLEWATASENQRHAVRMHLTKCGTNIIAHILAKTTFVTFAASTKKEVGNSARVRWQENLAFLAPLYEK